MSEHVHKNVVHQIENGMPGEDIIVGLAEFYKVFGDATRVKILCALFQAESCVCCLAEAIGMTQSAVSHQLRVLKQMKLVKNRREGKTIYYSLADSHIQSIINQSYDINDFNTAKKYLINSILSNNDDAKAYIDCIHSRVILNHEYTLDDVTKLIDAVSPDDASEVMKTYKCRLCYVLRRNRDEID